MPELLSGYDFPMRLATMDGSAGLSRDGHRVFAQSAEQSDAVYSCGPNPMLAALQQVLPPGIPGLCQPGGVHGLRCRRLLRLHRADPAGGVEEHRTVCKDGPVFELDSVVFRARTLRRQPRTGAGCYA